MLFAHGQSVRRGSQQWFVRRVRFPIPETVGPDPRRGDRGGPWLVGNCMALASIRRTRRGPSLPFPIGPVAGKMGETRTEGRFMLRTFAAAWLLLLIAISFAPAGLYYSGE